MILYRRCIYRPPAEDRIMSTAMKVALHLVNLANSGEEPDPLTHLRLQKLLYYAQGWYLGIFGRALFTNRIEAWRHGPVVPDVYKELKKHGGATIAATSNE